jgi:hypothetical protein
MSVSAWPTQNLLGQHRAGQATPTLAPLAGLAGAGVALLNR